MSAFGQKRTLPACRSQGSFDRFGYARSIREVPDFDERCITKIVSLRHNSHKSHLSQSRRVQITVGIAKEDDSFALGQNANPLQSVPLVRLSRKDTIEIPKQRPRFELPLHFFRRRRGIYKKASIVALDKSVDAVHQWRRAEVFLQRYRVTLQVSLQFAIGKRRAEDLGMDA